MKLRLPKQRWQQLSFVALGIIATVGLLCFRLRRLVPQLATAEIPLPVLRPGLQALWDDPVHAPLQISRLVVRVGAPFLQLVTASRLASVIVAIAIVGLMYWLLRHWYRYRLAFFGSILLVSAPWFLHVARLATNDVLLPLAMTITLVLAALWHSQQRRLCLLYITAVLGGISLYVPAGLWLLLVVVIFERKNIIASLRRSKLHSALSSLLLLGLLVPLLHGLVIAPGIYRQLLGLPAVWPSWLAYLQRVPEVWEHIFIRGYSLPLYNLGGLPIVDVFTSLSFITGIYLYLQHRKATRTRLLAVLWLVGTLLVALGSVNITVLLPIVVVLSTGGIGYLLHLWLKVFPRNPLARAFGIGLVGLVIVFTVAYNVRNYFIAWPNGAATRATFHRQH